MSNTITILGDRWMHIYASLHYGLWSYENNILKAENAIAVTSEEIDEEIKKLEIMANSTPEGDSNAFEALEILRKIKQKLN